MVLFLFHSVALWLKHLPGYGKPGFNLKGLKTMSKSIRRALAFASQQFTVSALYTPSWLDVIKPE